MKGSEKVIMQKIGEEKWNVDDNLQGERDQFLAGVKRRRPANGGEGLALPVGGEKVARPFCR